jgi:uncharacterized protein (DUF427 family)
MLLAEGPRGWRDIAGLEGNFYVPARHLRTDKFKLTPIPGLCFYKFVYLWMDLELPDGGRSRMLGWKYVVPNPLFPMIAWRVGIPGRHPEIRVTRLSD